MSAWKFGRRTFRSEGDKEMRPTVGVLDFGAGAIGLGTAIGQDCGPSYMRTILRWIIRATVTLIFSGVLLVVALVLLKDVLAKTLTERNLRDGTGMDAQITRMELGLATPTMNMQGLKIYNPAGFGGGSLLDLPEMRMEYDIDAAGQGKIRLKTLRVHLAELHLVKDKNGVSNLDLLDKHAQERKRRNKEKDPSAGDNFDGIDTLYLTIDRLRFTDLADARKNQVLNIGLKDAVMQNLKTQDDITGKLMWALLPVLSTNEVVRENLFPALGDIFKASKKAKRPRAEAGSPVPAPAR